jgi:uncharacterized protein (TIGR02300 family)
LLLTGAAATWQLQGSTVIDHQGISAVAKPEWGRKRICHGCGAIFYDLRRDPIVCPKCGSAFDPEATLKSRRARVVPVEDIKPEVPEAIATEEAEVEEAEVEVEDEEDKEAKSKAEQPLLEDASDLTEDEDDVAEVREHLEEDEET